MSAPVITQRYWDEVKEGEEISGFEMFLSETKMVEQVSGSQDFYPVHHDREFARAGGHPDVFFNTGFTRAAMVGCWPNTRARTGGSAPSNTPCAR